MAKQSQARLLENPQISDANKAHLRRFLQAYDVSAARLNIFCQQIRLLLERTPDVVKEMQDREKMNAIFKDLREKLGGAYYATVINVSLTLMRWLNDGEKPAGLKDIKNKSRLSQRRDLSPEDMVGWQDGLKMAEATNSVQFKAIIMTQLDGGFRPSEFIDLDYGDISREGKFFIARIHKGKTGSRNVILYNCAPFLGRWLQMHPSKKKDAPLWVMENPAKSSRANLEKFPRYQYRIIAKNLLHMASRAGVSKPVDMYNLRHSACTLSKMENVSPDLAAEKFGHSVEYYVTTYGRLTTKDKVERYRKHFGEVKEEEKPALPGLCQFCDTINVPEAAMCEKCGNPLNLKKALELKSEKDNELETLKKQMGQMANQFEQINTFMNQVAKEDPTLIHLLAGTAARMKKG
ncbi:site-specific integrase [Candidatus Woesearchaeota archaeon]|nr:site-specific integrase [Candidatus Woesearchaeota archaeon]